MPSSRDSSPEPQFRPSSPVFSFAAPPFNPLSDGSSPLTDGLSFGQSMLLGVGIGVGKMIWDDWQNYQERAQYEQEHEARRRAEAESHEARRAREEAERAREESERAREEAERAREESERAREESERAQEEAERARREAERRAAEERRLRELGVDPDRPVPDEEISQARAAINYRNGSRNIVLAGNLSSGKSSLLNALRNVEYRDDGYARVGSTETTMDPTQYIDHIHPGVVWYDTPGAGTQNVTAWGYYYNQKLFAYDELILVHDSTLTQSDIRILELCRLRRQPCFVVRTKCDIHIQNFVEERECTSEMARDIFLKEVQDDVSRFKDLAADWVTDFDFVDYVVSAKGVRSAVRHESPSNDTVRAYVDEIEFLRALGLLGD